MSTIEVTHITNEGVIEVRGTTIGDGKPHYHRHVVEPTDSLDGEDDVVKAVAMRVHTTQVVDDYKAMRAASRATR